MSDKIRALFAARFLPIRFLSPAIEASSDCATVIFSSGSTAEPKGIALSHRNILSNINSISKGMAILPVDGICSGLPFFHSFGFTATIWFPLIAGFRATYHPNPLDGAGIAQAVREDQSTILLATPTFLTSYMRKATPEDFTSLRLVIVGAEKLRTPLAEAFADKYGIRPLEGYGATELSPVASFNIPDAANNHERSNGTKIGTIGRILPGMCARIVDPESGKVLDIGVPGLLLIKGPNVMEGYLDRPDLTMEAIRDGWYVTGDIAAIDHQGFITLTDRLSRFSKIAGEMVPHGAIDEAIQTGLRIEETAAVTTAVSDNGRGERLVVVYNETLTDQETIVSILDNSNLPNLWRPSFYIAVTEIPVLGSGKLDLKEIRSIAVEFVNHKQSCMTATV